jgi:hypothetical protein
MPVTQKLWLLSFRYDASGPRRHGGTAVDDRAPKTYPCRTRMPGGSRVAATGSDGSRRLDLR